MKIEIRPIETKKWHGKTKEEDFTRSKSLSALVNANTRKYSVSMDEEEIEKYSASLGVDLDTNFIPGRPHPFWDSKIGIVKLENSTKFLNTDIDLEYVHYKILKSSKYVANSLADFEKGLYPDATHIIYNENEEAEVKAKKIEQESVAIALVNELSKTRKIEICFILAGKNLKNSSDALLTVAMKELVDEDPSLLIRTIKEDSDITQTHALVVEAIQKGHLVKKGHKIYWFEDHIADTIESAVEYLNKDENQELKLRIMEILKN